jgi:hypothetical protein
MSIGTRTARDVEQHSTASERLRTAEDQNARSTTNLSLLGTLQSQVPGQLDRIRRLIVQLEAQPTASVLSDCHRLDITPGPRNKALLVLALTAVWLSALSLALAWIPLTGNASQTVEQISLHTQRLIPFPHESQNRNGFTLVGQRARASATSSVRLDRTKKSTNLRGDDPRRGQERVMPQSTSAKGKSPKLQSTSVAASEAVGRSEASDPLRDTKPTESAVAHTAPNGTIDYWMLPHGPFFSDPARVVPIGRSPNGVYVHNLEDGRNYRLTRSGDWYILVVHP